MPRKPSMAQTEIPVAAARERLRYVEARRCTCGSPEPDKWGTRWKHKPPCQRAGKKF